MPQKPTTFDPIRKKYVVLTPEEEVRQNLLKYLIEEKLYSPALIRVEYGFNVGETQKRADIVIFSKQGIPIMIIECKAPSIPFGKEVQEQVSRYNLTLSVRNILFFNGIEALFFNLNSKRTWDIYKEVPTYDVLINL